MTTLPQQNTYNQYEQLVMGATTFTYSYYIPKEGDIDVYLTPPGAEADPVADLQVLNTDYTVTDAGNLNGGTIVFTVAPAVGSFITLVRAVKYTIDTDFADARNFNGATLDAAFQRLTVLMQQLDSNYNFRALQYIINSPLPQATFDTPPTANKLPVLTDVDNQVWKSQGGAIISAVLQEPADVTTLRSDLASQAPLGDGASLIGYYDTYNSLGQTLDTFLNNLPTYIIDIVTGFIPATGFNTGDVKASLNPVADPGWIIWQNGTIGNAASGATILADASASVLFGLLWDTYPDSICPVSGGVRGASAAADFAANKTIGLPNVDGKTMLNAINANTLINAALVPGGNFGEVDHALIVDEMPAHNHPGSVHPESPGTLYTGSPSPFYAFRPSIAQTVSSDVTIASQGGGMAHNNVQPSIAVYYHMKL